MNLVKIDVYDEVYSYADSSTRMVHLGKIYINTDLIIKCENISHSKMPLKMVTLRMNI